MGKVMRREVMFRPRSASEYVIGARSGERPNWRSMMSGIESVNSGRRMFSSSVGTRRLEARYRAPIPPSSAMARRRIVKLDGVLRCAMGIAIRRVRTTSSGERMNWVIACDAT
jgi:hypothetical protein